MRNYLFCLFFSSFILCAKKEEDTRKHCAHLLDVRRKIQKKANGNNFRAIFKLFKKTSPDYLINWTPSHALESYEKQIEMACVYFLTYMDMPDSALALVRTMYRMQPKLLDNEEGQKYVLGEIKAFLSKDSEAMALELKRFFEKYESMMQHVHQNQADPGLSEWLFGSRWHPKVLAKSVQYSQILGIALF